MTVQVQAHNRLLKYWFVDKTCLEYKNYLKKLQKFELRSVVVLVLS